MKFELGHIKPNWSKKINCWTFSVLLSFFVLCHLISIRQHTLYRTNYTVSTVGDLGLQHSSHGMVTLKRVQGNRKNNFQISNITNSIFILNQFHYHYVYFYFMSILLLFFCLIFLAIERYFMFNLFNYLFHFILPYFLKLLYFTCLLFYSTIFHLYLFSFTSLYPILIWLHTFHIFV